jgi:hypothetical protein
MVIYHFTDTIRPHDQATAGIQISISVSIDIKNGQTITSHAVSESLGDGIEPRLGYLSWISESSPHFQRRKRYERIISRLEALILQLSEDGPIENIFLARGNGSGWLSCQMNLNRYLIEMVTSYS